MADIPHSIVDISQDDEQAVDDVTIEGDENILDYKQTHMFVVVCIQILHF